MTCKVVDRVLKLNALGHIRLQQRVGHHRHRDRRELLRQLAEAELQRPVIGRRHGELRQVAGTSRRRGHDGGASASLPFSSRSTRPASIARSFFARRPSLTPTARNAFMTTPGGASSGRASTRCCAASSAEMTELRRRLSKSSFGRRPPSSTSDSRASRTSRRFGGFSSSRVHLLKVSPAAGSPALRDVGLHG